LDGPAPDIREINYAVIAPCKDQTGRYAMLGEIKPEFFENGECRHPWRHKMVEKQSKKQVKSNFVICNPLY
jgi:hypothetical protein